MVADRCDDATWAALVEASWQLGERLLFHTSPNLRGDDVGALQDRLGRLGFDCGKVDGIFGHHTGRALERFQRNVGLPVDGVCGAETICQLDRLARQSGSGPGVGVLREQELLRMPARRLSAMRIVVGHDGGFGAVTRSVARHLRSAGASVVPLDDPDPVVQAQTANRFRADVYIGLHGVEESAARSIFYAVPAFESVAGRALAEHLRASLVARQVVPEVELVGMRLPILRETRMPAVWCELGPVGPLTERAVAVADACGDALIGWAVRPSG
jgi:N-acetylmuramoyl-L-alanine amidase